MLNMTLNDRTRTELLRMSVDLLARGYDGLAGYCAGWALCQELPITEYDAAMDKYREWLNVGHTVYPAR